MVKVLPNNFTLFESQRILTPAGGEPLAVTCSDKLLFIAVEECTVEAYDLCTQTELARFRTVGPVTQLAYNSIGDCVVTLERKDGVSHGFVRVYFKWRGLSIDRPMRILMASIQRSVPIQNRIAAEIVELPSDSGNYISCLACCEYTGRIAVAMGSLLRIFYLERDDETHSNSDIPSSPLTSSHPHTLSPSPTPSIEILLDIQTHTPQLEMVSILGDYVAFVSANEARVVKLSLFHSGPDPIPDYHITGSDGGQSGVGVAAEGDDNPDPYSSRGEVGNDQHCIFWSPSAVWEAEKRAHGNIAGHVTSHDFSPNHKAISGDHMMSGDRHVTTESKEDAPLVGTVYLKSIVQATCEKVSDRATMEVLGPAEYVWGQPLTVTVNRIPGNSCQGAECRVLTMLYRRFSADVAGGGTRGSLGGGASFSQLAEMSFRSQRGATLPVRVQKGPRLGAEGGWGSLHSVRLIPTFSHNPSSESGPRQRELVGVSCFLANRFHSYLYDVHHRCRLLSSFSFMEKSRLATCDGMLLHALSEDSVETYTSRAFQAAIGNLPRGSVVIPTTAGEGDEWVGPRDVVTSVRTGEGGSVRGDDVYSAENVNHVLARQAVPSEDGDSGEVGACGDSGEGMLPVDPEIWLRSPIPPPNLDLTLVATSKFIGCCYLATSQDYVVVVTKGDTEELSTSGTSWLLQSLTLRKAKMEQMWNIYILKLKSATSLFHQFMEFADTMKDTSPPMRQHLLSEGHVLLRRQVLREGCTEEVMRNLQENCFQLADSLCHYSRWNGIETHASYYFIMSGRPIVDVVRHILSTHKSENRAAYLVLIKYLNLTLFEPQNANKQLPLLRPLADKVLELYAGDHVTQRAGHVTQKPGHVTGHVISLLLDSWLTGYKNEKALGLLERQLSSLSGSEDESCQWRMCHAMLCLKSDRAEAAMRGVSQVPKESLLNWIQQHLRLVLDSQNLTLTPLGKLVVQAQEDTLLKLLLHFLKTQKMTFDDLCTLLKDSEEHRLTQQHTLKHFLEMTVLDRSKVISEATITKAVIMLVEILFSRLISEMTAADRSSRKSPLYALHGIRHKWLDSVAPLGGGEVEGEEGRVGGRGQDDRLRDLLQLQTLLCSSHMTEAVATRLDELLRLVRQREAQEEDRDGEREVWVYGLSLQLLAWPLLGRKKEACQLCLSHCPQVIIDYCQTIFPDDLDLWAWLLGQFLGNTTSEGDPSPLQDLYISLYKDALAHVVTLTTPEQFLSLLPPSGSAEFFLPFIERSFRLQFSRIAADKLHASILEQ